MEAWWVIRYFDRKTSYKTLDSSMIPFKLLPELESLDVRRGHLFKTDEFEIEIPGADIKLHMPTKSLWLAGKPHLVKGAKRIVLFNRNYHRSDGKSWKEVCIGLLTEHGHGLLIKHNMETGIQTIKKVEGNIPDPQVVFQDQPKLPDLFENEDGR